MVAAVASAYVVVIDTAYICTHSFRAPSAPPRKHRSSLYLNNGFEAGAADQGRPSSPRGWTSYTGEANAASPLPRMRMASVASSTSNRYARPTTTTTAASYRSNTNLTSQDQVGAFFEAARPHESTLLLPFSSMIVSGAASWSEGRPSPLTTITWPDTGTRRGSRLTASPNTIIIMKWNSLREQGEENVTLQFESKWILDLLLTEQF